MHMIENLHIIVCAIIEGTVSQICYFRLSFILGNITLIFTYLY